MRAALRATGLIQRRRCPCGRHDGSFDKYKWLGLSPLFGIARFGTVMADNVSAISNSGTIID
jgi:hypothetical protein